MSEVGIRALKQNASKVVARAKAGESITITEHGKPVARLVPIRKNRIEELIEAGLATPPTRRLSDLPPPAPRRKGQAPLSEVIDEQREDRI
ncbi:MAG: type II toxin-antitoxin system prevent-host-death family antitoxin [Actinomycetota bacterium]|nr:type II toxin-antitoxin system prevent-host-death family antitoxin [Actinomycetota bacterium]MDK1016732.1 type II toxin-antitoxin system prevent-host-death family antitoxin [Actinomycetota bacterium]MDK1026092.1 type II toxin-antitoxin system prevent-host-death family antitoxin [Actinomycetota bacterium]MDK1096742.1 type II toxin-antitoxin system prevent-host-death family antitoxin [Actinomycetota bacterium]